MKRKLNIAFVPGDGIGPEMFQQCYQVLRSLNNKYNLKIEYNELPYSADYYLKNDIIIPEERLQEIENDHDVLFLGPLGDRRINRALHARKMLYYIRNHFNLISTITHITHYNEEISPLKNIPGGDFDFYIFKENLEGFNFYLPQSASKNRYQKIAEDSGIYTRENLTTFIENSFQQAQQLGQGKVDLALKKYYLPEINSLWREIFGEVSQNYNKISTRIITVEQAEYHILKSPAIFDCIITPGFTGDQLITLGNFLLGSRGMSFNFNYSPDSIPVYHILHRAAKKYKGSDQANPLGTLRAFQDMLTYFERQKPANLIENSITQMFERGHYPLDLGGMLGTEETIDEILTYFEKH